MKKEQSIFNFDLVKSISDVVVPTAVITALGYYIGWSRTAAYYLSFGISPSFIDKSIPETMSAARTELALGLAGIVIAFLIYSILDPWKLPATNKSLNKIVWGLIFAVTLLTTIVLGYLSIRSWRLYAVERSYYLLLGVFLLIFWLTVLLGKKLKDWYLENRLRVPLWLRLLYPSHYIYLGLLLIVLIFFSIRVGPWKGSNEAARDMRSSEYLVSVSLYSKEKLPLSGIMDSAFELYEYQDLRLIDTNKDYFFVIQGEGTDIASIKAYAIPKREDVILVINP